MRLFSGQQFTWMMLLAVSFFVFNSCKKQSTEEFVSTDSSSELTPVLPINNPSKGVVTDTNAYVRVFENGLFTTHMGLSTDFSKSCTIDAGTKSSSISCIADVNELDLYFHGIEFQYNFPKTMCAYVNFIPPWHYNVETGYGPKLMTVTKTTNNGTLTGYTCNIDGVAGCTGAEASYTSKDGWKCVYNSTDTIDGGANCCLGEYVETTVVNEVGTTPSTTTTTTKGKWGGDVKTCIGGPARTNWDSFDKKTNYPLERLYYVKGKGLNKNYKVDAPMARLSAASLSVANYYLPYSATATYNHRHSGYVIARSTDLPYMVDPVDDRNGSAMVSGQGAYLWRCMDENEEVINTIKVYLREWNTAAEYAKYISTSGAQGNPDVTGQEGVDCDYTSGNGTCDDMYDFDFGDIFKIPNTAPNRQNYFPYAPY